MLDAGVTVALSSDAPVVEDDSPLRGMQAAVLRRDADGEAIAPAEAISIDEALDAYTRGGAVASGDDADRGCLRPGMQADLAALSGDPRTTPPEALTVLRVTQTWVGGQQVLRKRSNPREKVRLKPDTTEQAPASGRSGFSRTFAWSA